VIIFFGSGGLERKSDYLQKTPPDHLKTAAATGLFRRVAWILQ
jgi:hypothetical protein